MHEKSKMTEILIKKKLIYQLFLLLILVLPNVLALRETKAALMVYILLTFIFDKFFYGVAERRFLILLSAYVLLGGASIFLGLLSTHNGFVPYVIVSYIVGPLFWTFFLSSYIKKIGLKSLVSTIFLGGMLAALLIIFYYIFFDSIPFEIKEILTADSNVTLTEGVPRSYLNTISTLVFVVPAFFCAMAYGDKFFIRIPVAYQAILTTLCMVVFGVASLVSGRVALIIPFILSLVYLATRLSTKNLLLYGIFAVGSLVILSLFGIDFYSIIQYVIEKVSSYGGSERTDQHVALLNAFFDNPIFGNGHGTNVWVIRNEDKPWQYELFYHAMLFHTGLIGFISFLSLVLYSLWNTTQKLKAFPDVMRFIVIGNLGILFASYTNPYIEGFESQWMLTLPWAIALTRIRDIKI